MRIVRAVAARPVASDHGPGLTALSEIGAILDVVNGENDLAASALAEAVELLCLESLRESYEVKVGIPRLLVDAFSRGLTWQEAIRQFLPVLLEWSYASFPPDAQRRVRQSEPLRRELCLFWAPVMHESIGRTIHLARAERVRVPLVGRRPRRHRAVVFVARISRRADAARAPRRRHHRAKVGSSLSRGDPPDDGEPSRKSVQCIAHFWLGGSGSSSPRRWLR